MLVGGAVTAWPLALRAQQSAKTWRVGQVVGGTSESAGHLARALEQRLGELGYVQGKNLMLITRFAVPQPKAMEDAVLSIMPDIDLLVAW